MLASIQFNSNRPNNISDFVANVEKTASNPQDIEIICHIDEGDDFCKNLLKNLQKTSRVKIKYLQTNIIKGYKDLWKPLNELLKLTDPNAYFVTNFSDEFMFKTKGWDDVLRGYINYYEDDIFRIRLSRYRFRNYTDFWECVFAPDSLAFYTKKWMNVVGMWCPCLGPDSWQQLVSFYLINSQKFDHIQYNRDIAESFIQFEGEGASIGLTGLKAKQRIRDNLDLWFETVSYEMQEKAKFAAAKLQAEIIIYKNLNQEKLTYNFVNNRKPPIFNNKNKIFYKNNEEQKIIEIYNEEKLLYKINYKINKLWLFFINNIRKPNYGYYAGGGQECYRKDLISQINVYSRMKKYGVYSNNYQILQKPKFFKKFKLNFIWPILKIIILLYLLTKYLLYKILKKCGIIKYIRLFKARTRTLKTKIKLHTADQNTKVAFGTKTLTILSKPIYHITDEINFHHKPKKIKDKWYEFLWPFIKILRIIIRKKPLITSSKVIYPITGNTINFSHHKLKHSEDRWTDSINSYHKIQKIKDKYSKFLYTPIGKILVISKKLIDPMAHTMNSYHKPQHFRNKWYEFLWPFIKILRVISILTPNIFNKTRERC